MVIYPLEDPETLPLKFRVGLHGQSELYVFFSKMHSIILDPNVTFPEDDFDKSRTCQIATTTLLLMLGTAIRLRGRNSSSEGPLSKYPRGEYQLMTITNQCLLLVTDTTECSTIASGLTRLVVGTFL